MDDVRLTKLATCAGCGAKVGAGRLAELLGGLPARRDENLLVGFDRSDDASVYRLTDELALVQTVDFFPPVADDPFTFGAVAAANALSDVYAMGGEPRLALNIMAVPEDMPKETVREILRGGYEKVCEAGALITGGHSIYDPEPKYGLAVTGFVHPARLLTNSGARPGDELIYTKRLGVGVLTSALKAGIAEPAAERAVLEQMMTLNRAARDIMLRYDVRACTDVTGFGLLGHLLEMAQGSDTEILIRTGELEFLPQAEELARLGVLPAGMYRNRSYAEPYVDPGSAETALQDLLYDPQTSGGLMIAAAPEDAAALTAALRAAGLPARRMGCVRAFGGGKRLYLQ